MVYYTGKEIQELKSVKKQVFPRDWCSLTIES